MNTLYEQVARSILQDISAGLYQKGDMLPSEKELMLKTGVSRITVREALKTLSEKGIIETRHGKGSFVLIDSQLLSSDKDNRSKRERMHEKFIESSRARLMLEPEIARCAAENATDEELALLEKTIYPHRCGRNPEKQFNEFHRILAQAAHNPLILSFMESLIQAEDQIEKESKDILTLPEKQKAISDVLNQQHRKIYEAVKERNGEFAYFYMKEHMRFLLKSYEEFYTWFV